MIGWIGMISGISYITYSTYFTYPTYLTYFPIPPIRPISLISVSFDKTFGSEYYSPTSSLKVCTEFFARQARWPASRRRTTRVEAGNPPLCRNRESVFSLLLSPYGREWREAPREGGLNQPLCPTTRKLRRTSPLKGRIVMKNTLSRKTGNELNSISYSRAGVGGLKNESWIRNHESWI